MAVESDIPFLTTHQNAFSNRYDSNTIRDNETWKYLLNHGSKIESGSEFWIGERDGKPICFYRRPYQGFGEGLIVSEVSEHLEESEYVELLNRLKTQGLELNKPYLRINLSNKSGLSLVGKTLKASNSKPYAFQIKIPKPLDWLRKQIVLFEQRLASSSYAQFTGRFRLDTYRDKYDLNFQDGKIQSIEVGSNDCETGINIPVDLLPSFLLGAHTWRKLQTTRPDVIPYGDESEKLADILFPLTNSWHQAPY